jgi:hypothetical protein
MDLDSAPELVGGRVRLRALHDGDVARRAALGRSREIVRAFGGGVDVLALHRVSLKVVADNVRAVAAYRKCGFVAEGRLRQTFFRDGEWHDDLSMAILAPEWAETRLVE